jgi:hypothetical protein
MNQLISTSLETCAELEGDITEKVYAQFFTTCEAALPLMDHSDQYMKGRMLAQVFELLLDDDHLGEGGYLRWEVNNHLLAYGVDVVMYRSFLDALCDVVKKSLGTTWTVALARAWATKIDQLLAEIYSEASA